MSTLVFAFDWEKVLAKINVFLFSQVLDTTHSHKTTKKVTDVLTNVTSGLVENSSLELRTLLTFTFGLITEVLPMLKSEE